MPSKHLPRLSSKHLTRLPRTSRILGVLAILLIAGGGALAAQIPYFVSPALPTTLDPVSLEILPTCNAFQIPTRAGNTITFQVGPLIPAPCPRAGNFPLGMLPAGSYTVVEEDSTGAFLSSSVFQVNAPATSVNLLSSRFAVTASWTDPAAPPAPHTANAVQLSDQSGYFWFFGSDNVELSVKMLDGTTVNGHFWVFIASMTNVAFTVTISDTDGGGLLSCTIDNSCPSKTYTATAGINQNFIDLGSFANPAAN